LNLPPDILEVLRQGEIAYTKAKAIASVKDPEIRQELLQIAIEDNLSLAAIKEKIAQSKPKRDRETPDSQIKNISRHLSKSKLWQQDPQHWEKVREYLAQIERLLGE
jgi:ParB family chromosome partitioning protein